eukprot:TRINITY_DN4849_c1_g1_i1.p1 TRINITY_DN4849_c1_g1~~TRINITY_DN4849_c1_g1_i1.p1  ORF type:complete len:384 (+),score=35.14 TRINITY_DN4849_c1_g1_i1:703-1854(+)
MIVYEPEAAAISCMKQHLLDLVAGDVFMVVDAGGGTVDLTSYRVEAAKLGDDQTKFKEAAAGSGRKCGGTYIDENFIQWVKTKTTPGAWAAFERCEAFSGDIYYFLSAWEVVKQSLKPRHISLMTHRIALPAALWDLIPSQIQITLMGEANGHGRRLLLTPSDAEFIFAPQLTEIEDLVCNQLQRTPGCTKIVLVGGFARSQLLQHLLRDRFERDDVKVFCPTHPARSVMEGATLSGIEQFVSSRYMRMTYGVDCQRPLKDGEDSSSARLYDGEYFTTYFSVFVNAHEEISIDSVITHTFHPMTADQAAVRFLILSCLHRHPKVPSEEGVKIEGTIRVPMEQDPTGKARSALVDFRFGTTEIEVYAYDVRTPHMKHRLQINYE